MIQFIKWVLGKIDSAAEWVADRIISKPKFCTENVEKTKAAEAIATGTAAYGLGLAATTGGIALTEALAAASVNATAVQAAAAIAAAGTEVAAGGAALASGSGEVIAIGAALLFSGAVVGKVAIRAAGHLYQYLDSNNNESKDVAIDAMAQRKLSIS